MAFLQGYYIFIIQFDGKVGLHRALSTSRKHPEILLESGIFQNFFGAKSIQIQSPSSQWVFLITNNRLNLHLTFINIVTKEKFNSEKINFKSMIPDYLTAKWISPTHILVLGFESDQLHPKLISVDLEKKVTKTELILPQITLGKKEKRLKMKGFKILDFSKKKFLAFSVPENQNDFLLYIIEIGANSGVATPKKFVFRKFFRVRLQRFPVRICFMEVEYSKVFRQKVLVYTSIQVVERIGVPMPANSAKMVCLKSRKVLVTRTCFGRSQSALWLTRSCEGDSIGVYGYSTLKKLYKAV